MATTEILHVTFPGWVTFTLPTGDTTTARASFDPRGIAIDLPVGPVSRMTIGTEAFSALEPRAASHLEALSAALAMLDPDHVEKALALVLETCEDASEAYGHGGMPETAEALSRFAAAWRGTSID
jgi:hypothetical protein